MGFGRFGGLPQPLHALPLLAEDALGLLGRVEDVQGVLRHGLTGGAAALLQQGDPALQALARIRHDVLQRRPGAQRLQPRPPGAVGGPAPRNQTRLVGSTPTRTGRPWKKISSRHPTRIKARHWRVEDRQDPPGAAAGRLDDPVQGRAAGTGRGAQDDGQEPADLVEAQAHRGGGDSELLPSGLGEVDGLLQPRPELRILVAQGLELVEELLPRRSAGMLGFDGGVDLLGMVVGGLPATAGLWAWAVTSPCGPQSRRPHWRSRWPRVS